jgi:kinesin family protein C1
MALAATHRCVAATDMNAVSSRSHAVFTLHLTGTNAEQKARLKGALNLVDLAGSERLDRSNAVGQRAKEAAMINKSLSALAGVFAGLHKKQAHVPYRDSKLTFLLQPALSGDGKTLLFVNLSPTDASVNESLCSLKFAKQVNQVELGKATRHIETVH